MMTPKVFCYHRCIDCGTTKLVGVKEPYPKGWFYDDDSEDDGSCDVCPDCVAARGLVLCPDCGTAMGENERNQERPLCNDCQLGEASAV